MTSQLAAFTDDLAEVQRLVAPQRVALLGHGWGAILAVEYALARPDAVTALILVSPLRILNAEGQDSEAQARMVARVDQTLLQRWTQELQPAFIAALKEGAPWDRVEAHPWWAQMIRTQFASAPPPEWDDALAGQRWGLRAYATYKGAAMFDPGSAMARFDLAADAAMLPSNLPVLIFSSNNDANYVAPAARHAAPLAEALPQAQLVQWDDVGHFPFVERSHEFAAAVEGFL